MGTTSITPPFVSNYIRFVILLTLIFLSLIISLDTTFYFVSFDVVSAGVESG